MLKTKMNSDQRKAKEEAAKLLDGSYVFMDTETTGVSKHDEVINLAFSDVNGDTVYSKYFKNEVPMNPSASEVSGITDESLSGCPTFVDEWNNIVDALDNRKFAIFNAQFDTRLLRQTYERYESKGHLPKGKMEEMLKDNVCTMKLYDRYVNTSVWIKMEEACHAEGINVKQDHQAGSDTYLMVELIKKVADPNNIPSLYKVYNSILDKEDDPSYKPNKQRRILSDVISRTMKKFNDALSKHKPSSEKEAFDVFKKIYDYDFPMNFAPERQIMKSLIDKDNDVRSYLKKQGYPYKYVSTLNNYFTIRVKCSYNDRFYTSNAYGRDMSSRCVDLYNRGHDVSYISKVFAKTEYDVCRMLTNSFRENPDCVDLSKWVLPEYVDDIVDISQRLETEKMKDIREEMFNEGDFIKCSYNGVTRPDGLRMSNSIIYNSIAATLAYNDAGELDALKEKSQYNVFDYETRSIKKQKNDFSRDNVISTGSNDYSNKDICDFDF